MENQSKNIMENMQKGLDDYNKTKEKNYKDIDESINLGIELYLAFVDKIILFSSGILSVFSSIYLVNLKDINIDKFLLILLFASFLLSIVFGVFIRFLYSKYYLYNASLIYIKDEKNYLNSLFGYENSDKIKINSESHKKMGVFEYKDLEKKEKETEKNMQSYLKKSELLTGLAILFFIIGIILLLLLFFSII